MKIFSKTIRHLAVLMTVIVVCSISAPAAAIKYKSLKEAVKHFMPKDAKLSKVTKTIPGNKLAALKKQFDLAPSTDFKEKLAAGPYDIYIGRDGAGKAKVYMMVLDQYWRTCYHKYAVALDGNGKIKEMVVMEFNCKYQYPLAKNKGFLKQFVGKSGKKGSVHLGKDIDAISGATKSCDATAIIARKALAIYDAFFAGK